MWNLNERSALPATVLRAQVQTGAPLSVHTLEILQFRVL